MKTKTDALYTTRIIDVVATYVIDDDLVKDRGSEYDLIRDDGIKGRIKNFKNIAIQTDRNIEIYCDKDLAKHLVGIFRRDKNLFRLCEDKTIQIFTK